MPPRGRESILSSVAAARPLTSLLVRVTRSGLIAFRVIGAGGAVAVRV